MVIIVIVGIVIILFIVVLELKIFCVNVCFLVGNYLVLFFVVFG